MKRTTLFNINPHCHWCGTLTRLIPADVANADDAATVDHVNSRHVATSRAEWSSRENKVLACLKCNRARNQAELAANPRPIVKVDCPERRYAMWKRKAALYQRNQAVADVYP